jgi:plasmid replication initiation protein
MSNDLEVYKSNSLIEASYRLSPNEQGIILACIAQIRKDSAVTDQTMYKISAVEFSKLTGSNPKHCYRDIKEAALRLQDRKVVIRTLPNGAGPVKKRGRTLHTGWVQSVEYSDVAAEIQLRFCHDMLPYLTNLSKNFTKYALKNVAKMSSGFGVRIYEFFSQWLPLGKNELEFSLDELKKTLMVEGKYEAIKDFKKKVLLPAIADINKHSDISASWSQKKIGRKITHIIFNFELKNKEGSTPPTTAKGKQEALSAWKANVEKNAKPGETYEQASARLKAKEAASKRKAKEVITQAKALLKTPD